MHFQSPETIIMNAVNISRFLSLQYSFIVGLSYLFIELASFVAIAIAVFALIKYLFGFELVQDKKFEVNHSVDFLQSNDIYLKISKFIC